MNIKPGEITDILKREIKEYEREIDIAETGTVRRALENLEGRRRWDPSNVFLRTLRGILFRIPRHSCC